MEQRTRTASGRYTVAHTATQPLKGWSEAPEILYGDIVAKASLWADLSKKYALQGDGLAAARAAWASDVCTIQAVSWDAVALADPHPEQMYFLIGSTVTQALSLYADAPGNPTDLYDAVRLARRGVAAAFERDILRRLKQLLFPLDHLAGLTVPTADQIRVSTTRYLGGQTAQDVIAQKRATAATHGGRARAAHHQGHAQEALNEMYASDMAAYHAYLIDASSVVGDTDMALAQLRWQAGCDRIAGMRSLPTDYVDAVSTIRAHLTWVVGPAEGDRLDEYLETIDVE